MESLEGIEDYPVDAFLLDKQSPLFGGTGETFDWSLAVHFKEQTKKLVILAGGLNLENIALAIETVRPYGVDICSGLESSPGKKDHSKMKDFIQICRQF